MRGIPRLFLTILILLFFSALPAHGWSGRVCGVADGDTISVLHEGRPIKIRLYGIDCPESTRPSDRKRKHSPRSCLSASSSRSIP